MTAALSCNYPESEYEEEEEDWEMSVEASHSINSMCSPVTTTIAISVCVVSLPWLLSATEAAGVTTAAGPTSSAGWVGRML